MSNEPDNLVLELLRAMRADMAEMRTELKGDIASLRADVASDFVLMESRNKALHKNTDEQISGLRKMVMQYHSSVIGHGILYSELEERVQRMEQHLNLPFVPKDAH